jgi:hypothetical protein
MRIVSKNPAKCSNDKILGEIAPEVQNIGNKPKQNPF